MSRRQDDDLARVEAAEDPPALPGPEALFVRLLTVVVCLTLAWGFGAGACYGSRTESPEVAALRAREDSAHVRVHRAQASTAARLADARRATTRAEAAVTRYVQARRNIAPVVVQDSAHPEIASALPVVPGGWGTVTDGVDTLPTPRAVIGALIARDSALALADAAITEQRLALTKWAVAGRAFLAELAAHEEALAAVQTRMQAQIRAERARARRLWWTGAAVGLVGGLALAR